MADAPDSSLSIRLFGPFEMRRCGAPLPRLRTRKGQWLLALLALRPGAELERDWLAGTLWPESSGPAALVNLRGSIKDLRRTFGPAAACLCSPTKSTLLLDPSAIHVDLLAFDAAIARGDSRSLQEGVALYRGPLLEDCAEAWILPERQAREQAYLRALETLAAEALARSEPASAEQYLRLAVAVDPLRESAQRELMRVLAGRGSYAAALQTYRDLRLRLHRELNAAPDPQTQQLFERIRGKARLLLGPPQAAAPHPRPPGNLPVPPTPLLGRNGEMETLRQLLRSGANDGPVSERLLTLTGSGGTGKTRLALQAAAEQRGEYGDGALLVSLAPIRDPNLVASAIGEALGLREEPGEPLIVSLKGYLREKELLLLLDNFEQLLPAAPLVAELLAAAPRLTVLVTSRAALRLRGEKLLPVSPLALPPLVEGRQSGVENSGKGAPCTMAELSTLTRYPAVQLFIQRAQEVRPDFALVNETAPVVAEICRRLDGLPLAIELAAARIRFFSPQALLTCLESRLDVLVGGPRDLPARQQTLRNTIAWSYELLDTSERQLFRRLAIFAGGCTLEAAEAVTAAPAGAKSLPGADAVAGLISLLDQSLLRREEGDDGQPRLTMLETIRAFAWERLIESGEAELLRQRHAGYFVQLAEEAEPELRGAEAPFWQKRLDAEHENLRAALTAAIASGDAETGLRLIGALVPFWRMRRHWAEGQSCADRVLALPGAAPRTPVRAKALTGAALMARRQGHSAAVLALYAEALSISRKCGDRTRAARILEALGDLAREAGRVGEAQPLYDESLALYRELGDQQGQAGLLMSMGLMRVEARDPKQATVLLEQSRAMYRELGDSWGMAASTVGLSTQALLHEHDLEKARRYAEECLTIYRHLGALDRTALGLSQLADIVMQQGNTDEAATLLEESLAIAHDLDDPWRIAHVLQIQAKLALRQGDTATAAKHCQESARICRARGLTTELCAALDPLGYLALRQEDFRAARDYFVEALATQSNLLANYDVRAARRRHMHQVGIARCLEGLAAAAAATGRPERAACLFGAAESLRNAVGDTLEAAGCKEREGQPEAVRAMLGEATFTRAYAAGQAMALEQAVSLALSAEGPHSVK